ncbi:hypothetical protein DPEC_G00247370 [Dallia pectoralis]|uniref:Uncharacterized protein n=1 Tax=Dallia pectoralis TaxID=75939 RepID=A0ACC2FWU8_DALPE|nr:hypothetical protein DPEC_G00247370 [Dallia pectoralis]
MDVRCRGLRDSLCEWYDPSNSRAPEESRVLETEPALASDLLAVATDVHKKTHNSPNNGDAVILTIFVLQPLNDVITGSTQIYLKDLNGQGEEKYIGTSSHTAVPTQPS